MSSTKLDVTQIDFPGSPGDLLASDGSAVTVGSGLALAGGTLTSTGGGVTTVTASAPIASSGGATPNISLTGVVGVTNGGTGLSTVSTAGNILVAQTASTLSSVPVSGDASLSTAGAVTVVGMNGQAVTAGTAPGQLLQYNGVSWALKSGLGGTSAQLEAADGSNVNVGANLSLVGGVLSATGGAAGPWVSTGITGTANALPIFDPTGIASLLSEPGDKTNKVLGWAGGVLAWVVVASAVVVPSNQPYERDLVIANVDYENTDVGSSVAVFSGTVV